MDGNGDFQPVSNCKDLELYNGNNHLLNGCFRFQVYIYIYIYNPQKKDGCFFEAMRFTVHEFLVSSISVGGGCDKVCNVLVVLKPEK